MKIIKQLAIILAIWMAGEWISIAISAPVPGTVIGMLLLFLLLVLKVIKVQMLEELTEFLLNHLALFLIPPTVHFISSIGLLKGMWIQFMVIMIVTTILIMIVSGYTVQFMVNRKEKHERVSQ